MKRIDTLNNLFSEEEQININHEIETMPYFWGAADRRRWVKEPQRQGYQFWASTIYPTESSKFDAPLVTVEDVYKSNPNIMLVWDRISSVLEKNYNYDLSKYEFARIYTVAQYLGTNGSGTHQDIGDLSIVYYVTPNWKVDWDGGTVFFNDEVDDVIKYVPYKTGNVTVFDAKIPHKGMSISPKATDIRTILAFKLRLKN